MTPVPSPWALLGPMGLVLVRARIAEPGRYYNEQRTIVTRAGLLLVEERAVLWHELVHARRGDERCLPGVLHARTELSVDREAARWALPFPALLDAQRVCCSHAEAADLLKTTPRLLEIRCDALHPAERAALRKQRHALHPAA